MHEVIFCTGTLDEKTIFYGIFHKGNQNDS